VQVYGPPKANAFVFGVTRTKQIARTAFFVFCRASNQNQVMLINNYGGEVMADATSGKASELGIRRKDAFPTVNEGFCRNWDSEIQHPDFWKQLPELKKNAPDSTPTEDQRKAAKDKLNGGPVQSAILDGKTEELASSIKALKVATRGDTEDGAANFKESIESIDQRLKTAHAGVHAVVEHGQVVIYRDGEGTSSAISVNPDATIPKDACSVIPVTIEKDAATGKDMVTTQSGREVINGDPEKVLQAISNAAVRGVDEEGGAFITFEPVNKAIPPWQELLEKKSSFKGPRYLQY
jgi:hypothetical protein